MKTETGEKVGTMHAYPNGRWTVNPFKSGGAAGTPPPTVQGELSLDQVKPVRNDLSDADLELIAVKRAESKAENVFAAPVAQPVVPPAVRLSVWARLKTRLFGKKTK